MTRESPDTSGDIGRPHAPAAAEREAILWVVRLSSGEASAAERAAFARWRRQDPLNRAALAMARGLWAGLGPALSAHAARTRRRRQGAALALAASLLLTAMGYQALMLWHDPTRVALELDDSRGYCRLTLAGGEAFDVTPNPLPAVVGGETQVRMQGTAFSLRPDPAGVLVTVTGGQVEVNAGKGARVLGSGERLRCRSERHGLARIFGAFGADATGRSWLRQAAAKVGGVKRVL